MACVNKTRKLAINSRRKRMATRPMSVLRQEGDVVSGPNAWMCPSRTGRTKRNEQALIFEEAEILQWVLQNVDRFSVTELWKLRCTLLWCAGEAALELVTPADTWHEPSWLWRFNYMFILSTTKKQLKEHFEFTSDVRGSCWSLCWYGRC